MEKINEQLSLIKHDFIYKSFPYNESLTYIQDKLVNGLDYIKQQLIENLFNKTEY